MTSLLLIALLTFWGLCVAGIAWYILSLATQVTYVTLADGRQQARALPLIFRLLLPFSQNLTPLLKAKAFQSSLQAAAWQLVAAGYEGLLTAREFLALRFLIPFAASILFALMFFPLLGSKGMLPWMLGTLLAVLWPVRWLRTMQNTRAKSILRALPFVLDLLTLSVEAGMDFLGAIRRNCEHRMMDPLNEELLRLLREIQIGTTRKSALRNLSERLRIKQMNTLCAALIQADELGVSIGAILRIQSEQLRQERFDAAEKLAQEAPTKILFPLLLFIFPATIIVLLGPVLTGVFKSFL